MTIRLLRKNLLWKLWRRKKWGGNHTDSNHILKGCPSNSRGNAKTCLYELIKEGFVLLKKTPYGSGEHISLNPRMKKEIEEELMDWLEII